MKPAFSIEVQAEGQSTATDITAFAAQRLISLRLTDVAGIKSDVCELRLDYRRGADGKSIDLPPANRQMRVCLGYDESLPWIGTYTVDKIGIGGPPDTLTVHAVAARWLTSYKAPRSCSWPDNVTIGTLVATIAARHGYTPRVSAEFADVVIPHIDQTEESDANLLTRIAGMRDAIAKPMSNRLLFYSRGDGRKVSGALLTTTTINHTGILRWSYQSDTKSRYGSVEAVWHDFGAAEDKVVTIGDGGIVYRLRNPYPDEAAATAAATARYHKFQRQAETISLTVIGNPAVRAEAPLKLSGFNTGIPTDWVTTKVVHTLDRNGFVTAIDAKLPKGTAA